MEKDRHLKHPCFGLARFSRICGYSGFMFGSDVQSENFIELTINHAERVQGDYRVHYYDYGKSIVRLKMTQTQFAELLTNMNIGNGVPVTLEAVNGEQIEQFDLNEAKNHLDELKDDFKERSKKTVNSLIETSNELKRIINKKNLSKKDQEDAMNLLDRYITEIRSNMPFFIKLYKEETADIVQRAKSELDGMIQSCVIRAGVKALGLDSTPIKGELENV